jgi:filamentous hemagglutinin family protein
MRRFASISATRRLSLQRVAAAGAALLASPMAWGNPGVVLDGSFNGMGPLSGPNFIITAGMGRQLGPNLFQSFSSFNLTSSESATFTATGSTGPISNILARVTGGSASSIDGTINSQIAGANLFLLNPAGVMFGPHAQVNVTGSFVVGTPDYVQLADGGRFNTSLGNDSQLTSAAVSAFGFLAATPQPVSFAGTQLNVPAGTGLHVLAGNITLDQGSADGVNEQGTFLSAPSGLLTLFSAASAGEVPFSLSSPSTPPGSGYASATNTSFGAITMQNNSAIAINGAGGGNIVIRGGKITVDNSGVGSLNDGAVAGGGIAIQADEVAITDGGFVGSDSEPGATAGAGPVNVNVTGNMTISGGSQISANTETASNGGVISVVTGGNLTLNNGGNILANTDGAGNSGTVSVQAASLDIGSQSSGLSTVSNGAGNAGAVHVNVTGAISMTDNGAIAADTYGGAGGNITVAALQLNMTGTSLISANTVIGSGRGGNITVDTGSLSIEGTGHLVLALNKFLIGLTGITAESLDSGNAGSIAVNSGNLSLDAGAVISTASLGPGKGGPISVSCGQGQLSNQSEVSSTSFTDAGSVQITAGNSFSLLGNSSINTSAGDNGGDITLRVGQLLYLFDSNIEAYAGVVPQPNQVGAMGGNILIDPEFVVLDDSFISANDLAPGGQDGNILNAADFFFTNDSLLHATGTIDTTPPDLDLAESLVVLPASLVDAGKQLRERCATSVNHEFSSLIVVGRGGVETAPSELRPDFGASYDVAVPAP